MRVSFVSALVGSAALASAAVVPKSSAAASSPTSAAATPSKASVTVPNASSLASAIASATAKLAPALDLSNFKNPFVNPISVDDAREGLKNQTGRPASADDEMSTFSSQPQCGNPRQRREWDNLSHDERQNWVDSIKCLMNAPPSGSFSPSTSRYEDLVRLHQMYTPNIHGNSKFLIWHRYLLFVYESVLREECGFWADLPWFDEGKYAPDFSGSSLWSSDWIGGLYYGGDCVQDGQFAGITLNIGPGTGSQPHCLQRNGDTSKTANANNDLVDACNSYTDYKDMAQCAEGGVHAWGHNGIGGVMADVYGSPGDPSFWLHHAYVDRNFNTWQLRDGNRITNLGIDGTDVHGDTLTLDTRVNSAGLRPDRSIGEILDSKSTVTCYVYSY